MKAVIMAVSLPHGNISELEEDISELKELSRTAGYEIEETFILSSSKVFPATYISHPVAVDTEGDLSNLDAKTVIFSKELSPTQLKNLEEIFKKMVIDRTELILKIFQSNARTEEARVQVEIAQLKYTLPRLKRMWTHLSRIEGGFGFTKGPGETQIEVDRRAIKDRISKLNKKLKEISTRRETRRKKRLDSNLIMASLVGYTNAGKTSLLNKLAKETLQAENKLFATLSPVTRKAYLKENEFALLSDTVGFIKNLPPQLIASFHSTLQEIDYADLVIIVQDIVNINYEHHLDTVRSILGEIGCLDKPKILVFSKTDLIKDHKEIEQIKLFYPDAVFISSLTGEGIEELKERIVFESARIRKK